MRAAIIVAEIFHNQQEPISVVCDAAGRNIFETPSRREALEYIERQFGPNVIRVERFVNHTIFLQEVAQ